MRKSLAIPSEMFPHPPKLALPTGRFEPTGMIEQHVEAIVECRHSDFGPRLKPMLLQNESRLLFLPKEPGGSKHGSSNQHTIDSSAPHPTDDIMITVYVPITEQQRPSPPHNLSGSRNGTPIRFSAIHLLQSASM